MITPQALATPRNRIRTLILVMAGCTAAIAAALVGINDNPPGILLALAAAAAMVLAFVHPWRSGREFRRLLIASVLGFLLSVVLHNLFEALAGTAEDISVLRALLEGLGGATFLLATLVCPATLLVSVGALVMDFIANRLRTR